MKTICARAQLRRDGRRLESRHEIKQTIGMTTQVLIRCTEKRVLL
jgi:hypothetical protein